MGRPLTRHADFMQRLMAFAQAEMGRPFIWGKTNCVALALRALDAQCADSTLWHRWQRRMTSPARVAAFLRQHDFDACTALLGQAGLTLIDPAYAQPGDLLLYSTPEWAFAAGVNLGHAGVLSSTPERGVALWPRAAMALPRLAAGVR